MTQGDIAIYGAVRAMTGEGKAAYAQQVFDETQKKFQSAINQEVGGKVDKNSLNIEGKVNALIGIVQDLVLNVAFHSGVPFGIPQSILSKLSLLRIGYDSIGGDLPAICGHDTICGRVTCGIE